MLDILTDCKQLYVLFKVLQEYAIKINMEEKIKKVEASEFFHKKIGFLQGYPLFSL